MRYEEETGVHTKGRGNLYQRAGPEKDVQKLLTEIAR